MLYVEINKSIELRNAHDLVIQTRLSRAYSLLFETISAPGIEAASSSSEEEERHVFMSTYTKRTKKSHRQLSMNQTQACGW